MVHGGTRELKTTRRNCVRAAMMFAVATVVLGLTLGLDALTSGAVTLPSVHVPSVHVPSVSVPSVSTPLAKTPSFSTPSVSTPSVSAGGGGGGPSVSVGSGSGPSVSVGPSGVSVQGGGSGSSAAGGSGSATSSARSGSGSAGGAGASDAGAGAPARTAAQQRVYQRKLWNLVTRDSGCLSELPAQAARVLLLRAGVGVAHPYNAQQVAHALHITVAREGRLEQTAVSDVEGDARGGGCNGAATSAVLQVPAQYVLVSTSPISGSNGTLLADRASGGAGSGSGSARAGAGRVSGASASRGDGGSSSSGTALAQLASTTTSPTFLFVLGAVVLLGALGLMSRAGRRLAEREQLMLVGAGAGGAALLARETVEREAVREPVAVGVTEAVAVPEAVAGSEPVAEPEPIGGPEDVAGDSWVPSGLAEPHVAEAPLNGTSFAAPWVTEPSAAEPAVAEPAAPVPAAPAAHGSTQQWLRTHRSYIAIALTAAAGGTLRAMTRNRRR